MFSTEEGRVGFLASANISLAGIQSFLVQAEPLLRALLVVAQIAVAVVTVVYVYRKSQSVHLANRRNRRRK